MLACSCGILVTMMVTYPVPRHYDGNHILYYYGVVSDHRCAFLTNILKYCKYPYGIILPHYPPLQPHSYYGGVVSDHRRVPYKHRKILGMLTTLMNTT